MLGVLILVLLVLIASTVIGSIVVSRRKRKPIGPKVPIQQTPPAQAPAATTSTSQSWTGWMQSYTFVRRHVVWQLVVVALILVLLWLYRPVLFGYEFGGAPAWIYVLGILLILVFFGGTIKTRAVENQEIATVAAFVILLFMLGWVLYPEARPLLETPAALGFILLLVVAYCFFVIIKKVFWETSPTTAIIMILVLIAVLEPGVTRHLPDSMKARFHWGGTSTHSVSAPVGLCSGNKREVVFGAMPIEVNPNASCGTDFWHDGHCLYVKRAAWTGDRNTYRQCPGSRGPKDVQWAWSADTPFTGAVALVAPRYNF